MKNLLKTTKEQEAAKANFTTLLSHPGWQLFVDILNANIEVIKDQIINGVKDETPESINRLRDKLAVCIEMRDTPKTILDKLKDSEDEEINYDPYETADDIKARKAKEVEDA